MMIIVLVILVLVEHEIQDADGIDRLQAEEPSALLALRTDGERRVIDRAVLEPLQLCLLHLDDDLVALLVLAINIEYGAPVLLCVAQQLVGQQCEALDDLSPLQQGVDKVERQVLVGLRAEEVLEAVVGVGIYISVSVHVLLASF